MTSKPTHCHKLSLASVTYCKTMHIRKPPPFAGIWGSQRRSGLHQVSGAGNKWTTGLNWLRWGSPDRCTALERCYRDSPLHRHRHHQLVITELKNLPLVFGKTNWFPTCTTPMWKMGLPLCAKDKGILSSVRIYRESVKNNKQNDFSMKALTYSCYFLCYPL